MEGVVVVRDNDFVGVAAPTAFLAEQALEAIADDREVGDRARTRRATSFTTTSASTPEAACPTNPFADEVAKAAKSLKQTYHVAYVQHCPMEPRAAVAEWEDGKLTVWTGSQVPFGVKAELVRAFGLPEDRVRVIIPDFGGGFGGKHSGECAVEAARLAKEAGKPVRLVWTRAEEFTWAQFRPAGVIDAEASLDESGRLTSWHFVNINSGAAGSPDAVSGRARTQARYVESTPPLRHGSYRALAATANTFARECFMDELAALAGTRPARIPPRPPRSRPAPGRPRGGRPAVRLGEPIEEEGARTSASAWPAGPTRARSSPPASRSRVDRDKGSIARPPTSARPTSAARSSTRPTCSSRSKGALIMGLGPALCEEMTFESGAITQRLVRRLPGPPVRRRARARHPPARPARPPLRRRGRDAR